MKIRSIYIIGALKNWRVIQLGNDLRKAGFDAFDSWLSPGPEADGFLRKYTQRRGLNYKEALADYAAQHVFQFDKKHLDRCDAAVMLMPAGKSGHTELGYTIGKGKPGFILFDKAPSRYDVMHLFATDIFLNQKDFMEALRAYR